MDTTEWDREEYQRAIDSIYQVEPNSEQRQQINRALGMGPFDDYKSSEPIFILLNLNPYNEEERRKLDSRAIINEVEQNPDIVSRKYKFTFEWPCYPLHMAVALGASIDVVTALYTAYPQAIEHSASFKDILTFGLPPVPYKLPLLHLACYFRAPIDIVSMLINIMPNAIRETCVARGQSLNLPLHCACEAGSSLEVVSMLIGMYSEAIQNKGQCGHTPLHLACSRLSNWGSSFEVVSLLVDKWADGLEEKDTEGKVPLHYASARHSLPEVTSLLLEKWPEGIRQKDCVGNTPLHIACSSGASWDVVSILLEHWPGSVRQKDDLGYSPLDGENLDEEVYDRVENVYWLLHPTSDDRVIKEIIKKFTKIEWWGGIAIALGSRPSVVKELCLSDSVYANALSVVGRRCKIQTMCHMLISRQEIFSSCAN